MNDEESNYARRRIRWEDTEERDAANHKVRWEDTDDTGKGIIFMVVIFLIIVIGQLFS
jgi:hypothetical protein